MEKNQAINPAAQSTRTLETELCEMTREISLHQFRALLLMKSGDEVLWPIPDQFQLIRQGLLEMDPWVPCLKLTEKAGMALKLWTALLQSDLRGAGLV